MYLMEAPTPRPTSRKATAFHPGVAHNHLPTGRWADVQRHSQARCRTLRNSALADPRRIPALAEATAFECACANLSPQRVTSVAANVMRLLPLAKRHLDHYLGGSGANLKVDLKDVITQDQKVRAKLAAHVKAHPVGHFKINQEDFTVKDFQFAFGAIDRLDYEVDRAAGTIHVWFQDRYEWHPVGFGYKHFPDDGPGRISNCVHAAMVEMKRSGAKDYWMIGDAVMPLRLVLRGPSARTHRPKLLEAL